MLLLLEYYEWIKALHIISIIAWMAGLLYLPRLFVYHADAATGSELSETLKIMERRLLRFIMNPAMAAAYIFGLSMFWLGDWWADIWMIVKLVFVTVLTIYHHILGLWRKDFLTDSNRRSAKFYRMYNEVPTLCMIGIVFMVVLKPF